MKSYSNDLALLTVLVTHLGSCKLKSKSVPKISGDLSLGKEEVRRVLTEYPELFIIAGDSEKYAGEKTYTLHLRYALRWVDKNSDEEDVRKPIEAEHLSSLLTFIDNRVAQENSGARQKIANVISVVSAIVAAISALVAAYLAADK